MDGLSAPLLARLLLLACATPPSSLGAAEPHLVPSVPSVPSVPESQESETLDGLLAGLGQSDLSPEQEQQILVEAWQAFLGEEQAFRLDRAEQLALAMHARAKATWSALSLALLSTRMGEHERAIQVLTEQLQQSPASADRLVLLQRRAIAEAGAGNVQANLDLLGQALVLGGTDAQQMLGRYYLGQAQYTRAGALFSALLPPLSRGRAPYEADGQVPAWALRGWGVALLGSRADPVRPSSER